MATMTVLRAALRFTLGVHFSVFSVVLYPSRPARSGFMVTGAFNDLSETD